MTSTPLRRTAVLLTTAALVLLLAGPAGAEIPEGWSDPEEVGVLELLVVVLAIPGGLALLIALGVYLPALSRGENVTPGHESVDQWFGGPRQGAAELESRDVGTTGGGSGSW